MQKCYLLLFWYYLAKNLISIVKSMVKYPIVKNKDSIKEAILVVKISPIERLSRELQTKSKQFLK